MVSFTLEATASLSISPEGEQVRVKSSIYLGGRLLTCPADVRSRSKKNVPSELKCGRQLKKKWAGKREKGKRERGFSRKADKAGKKERERERRSLDRLAFGRRNSETGSENRRKWPDFPFQ